MRSGLVGAVASAGLLGLVLFFTQFYVLRNTVLTSVLRSDPTEKPVPTYEETSFDNNAVGKEAVKEDDSGACDEDRHWVGPHNPSCIKHYFSFVLCVRNDNYGGSFQQRLRAMVQSTLTLLSEHAGKPLPSGKLFSAEIVLVEYRPTEEQPPTKDILASYIGPYLKSKFLSVRVITVPESVIKTWPDPKKLIVAEYVGKNIGLRRARGEFVLAANADDILSSAAVSFISKGSLDYNAYYRAILVEPFFPPGGSDGWSDMPSDVFVTKTTEISSDSSVCEIYKPKLCFAPEPTAEKCKNAKACRVYAEERTYNGDICTAGGLHGAERVKNHPSRTVFTVPNLAAPGDFILMSRKNWFDVGGHAEVLAHRHHFDGWVECRALFTFGFAQVNLNPPCMVLHQYHGGKKFRQNIVSVGDIQGAAAAANTSGFFSMKLHGTPSAKYRTVFSTAQELTTPEVQGSRDLTDKWKKLYREPGFSKKKVLDLWDWNHQLNLLFGFGNKPIAKDLQKVCAKTARGGLGERLVDGNNYHPEHFGWPEWIFPEIIFEV